MKDPEFSLAAALTDDRIVHDAVLYAAATDAADWISGTFDGRPISQLSGVRRVDLAEHIEEGLIAVGSALGEDWSKRYHFLVWYA